MTTDENLKLLTPKEFKALGKLSAFNNEEIIGEFNEPATKTENIANYAYVAYIEGDLNLEGNLSLDDWFAQIEQTFKNDMKTKDDYIFLIWITGSLTISGTLYNNETEHYSDSLVVEKNVKIANIVFGGTSFYVMGNLEVPGIFYTQTRSEGWFSVKGKKNIKIEVDNNFIWAVNGQYYRFYEMTEEEKHAIFLKNFDFLEYDEEEKEFDFDEELFIASLLLGEEIFK